MLNIYNKNVVKKLAITSLFLISATSAATPVTYLEITGGSFDMSGTNSIINPGAFSNMTIGGFDGSPSESVSITEEGYSLLSIATFQFSTFGPVAVYTTDTDVNNNSYAAPSGDISGSNLTLDLGSWSAFWNGNSYNQGSSSDLAPDSFCVVSSGACSTAIITTYDSATGAFNASWSSVILGGGFDGQVGNWSIDGYVSAVPLPASIWLFVSGFIGLLSVIRRKNNN